MSSKINKFTKKDHFFMSLAFDLAKSKSGQTGTNPPVGCIIVDEKDNILSVGSTGYNGAPHAEANAIKNSTENLKNTTLYSTLEPCIHYGKTSPCTDKIIKAGIRKVIYAIEDIDPRVKSKAKKILSQNKIIVQKNLLRKKAKNFYNSYFYNRKKKLPYVIGKLALTKNNVIYSAHTKKITSNQSDKLSHFLRYKNDTILISVKTLNKDNPKLNCRLKNLEKYSPRRVIIDRNLDIDHKSYVFKTIKKYNTLLIYNTASRKKILSLKKKGGLLIKIKIKKNGYFDIKTILKKLYKYESRNVLIEGGLKLTTSFLQSKLVNEFYLFKNNKKDPLSKNFIMFKNFYLLKKLFKYEKRIQDKLNKDKIFWYN